MKNIVPAPFYIPTTASASSRHKLLRIAVVTETFAPEVNGVAMTLGRLVQGLAQRGHTITVHRPRQAHEAGLNMVPMQAGLPFKQQLYAGLPIPGYSALRFGLPATQRLATQWRQIRPDIVHVVTEGPLGWSAIRAARALHLPVSSSFHTNFDSYSNHYGVGILQKIIDRYLRFIHNQTLATMVPTRAMQQELQSRHYQHVSILSRGVETRLFHPSKRSATLRQQWGAHDHDLVCIHVGRLAKEKNIELVIQTYQNLLDKHPRAKLVLVGDGPMHKALQQAHPQVIFAGLQQGEALAQHYASADVFLFPSVTETFGNVVPEALASGLGVVAYARAAALELIKPFINGILVEQEDAPHFMAAAHALTSHTGALQAMREAAARSVSHLSWDGIFDAFIATLQQVQLQHQERYFPAIGASLATPLKLATPLSEPSA